MASKRHKRMMRPSYRKLFLGGDVERASARFLWLWILISLSAAGATPNSCSCQSFCSDFERIYTLNLVINSGSLKISDIVNTTSKLASLCNPPVISQSLCDRLSGQFNTYKNSHVQCNSNSNKLSSCTIAVWYSQPLNMCILDEVLVELYHTLSKALRTDPVGRTAVLCGSPGISTNTFFSSAYHWSSVNSKKICDLSDDQLKNFSGSLTCGQDKVQYVQLNESCQTTTATTTTTTTTTTRATYSTTTKTTTPTPIISNTTKLNITVTVAIITNPTTTAPSVINYTDPNTTTAPSVINYTDPNTTTAPSVINYTDPNTTTAPSVINYTDPNTTTAPSVINYTDPNTTTAPSVINYTDPNTTTAPSVINYTDPNTTTAPSVINYSDPNTTTAPSVINYTDTNTSLNYTTTRSPSVTNHTETNTTTTTSPSGNNYTDTNTTTTTSPSLNNYTDTTITNRTTTIAPNGTTTNNTSSNMTDMTTLEPTQSTAWAGNETTTTGTSGTTTNVTSPAETTTTTSQFLNQSQDTSTLNSSQVDEFVRKLEDILSKPDISLDVGQGALSAVNKLLDAPAEALASSSNRLIKVVEQLALKLVFPGTSATIALSSLALAVAKIDGINFPGMSFSIDSPSDILIDGRTRRSVASSSPQGSIRLPNSLTNGLTPEEKKQASRLQFTFFQKSSLFQSNLTDKKLNSLILGTSVANLSIRDLKDNVEFSLKNTTPINEKLTCVFWDFKKNEWRFKDIDMNDKQYFAVSLNTPYMTYDPGEEQTDQYSDGAGGWNHSGCFLKNQTDHEIRCSCNHLTSFAVLMDISQEGITDKVHGTILTFITFIGCGISAIFLAVTLLTYLAFDKLRRDIPSRILIQLCFALFLLNMVYLVDSWLALYDKAVGLCISTAFFLHYFLIASFTWMGLEALHLYLSIVKVFKNFVSHYMLKLSLAGWGIPLIIVIIVISVDKNNYGLVTYGKYRDGTTDDFCWIKNNIAFYVSVVAYFCAIFLANMIMFVVVMVQLRRIKRQNPQNNHNRKGLQDLRSAAGLAVLLGLTWGFAFFAWKDVYVAFVYLFAIFNSLQGFFIFVFHCAVKDSVRRQWRIYLCCGKYRLAENSDWSRLATQRTKKSSVLTANTSASFNQSTPSRNSSMSSESVGLPSVNNYSPMNDSGFGSSEESNRLTGRT